MYGNWSNVPQIIQVQVLSDMQSSLGNKFVPYNNLMPEALTKINEK